MTVGILGMAFKGGVDDIRSSLAYKLKRILRFKAARGALHRPVRHRRRRPVAARRGARAGRPADHRRAAPEYRDLGTDKPVVDIWNLLGRGRARVTPCRPRLGRHPGLQRGRGDRRRASTGSSRRSRCRARCWSSYDIAGGHHGARASRSTPSASRGVRAVLNTYGRGPAQRDPLRHRPRPRRRSSWSRWPTAATTRARSTSSPGWSSGAWSWPPRRATCPAGSRSAARCSSGCCPGRRAGRCYWFARVGTRDATNSFKAYSTDVRRARSASSADDGFEIGLELIAKARRLRLPVAEIPTIWLDRAVGRRRTSSSAQWLPSTSAGTGSPSARS